MAGTVKKHFIAFLLLISLLGPTDRAWADGIVIKAVTPWGRGGDLVLSVDLNQQVTPEIWPLATDQARPRLVIDFKGAKAAGLAEKYDSPVDTVRGIRLGRHRDKVRLVIDLVPGKYYQARQVFLKDQNRYQLTLTISP